MLRYVLRQHRRDTSASGVSLQQIVCRELPGDDFSLSQWQLGLDYYRARLAAFGAEGQVLLDIGCGSGNWALAAASRFGLVAGCDLGAARLACSRRVRDSLAVRNAYFCYADATALPFESESVDWALVYNVLPYVRGWRRVAPELARVVRPRGRVFVGWVDAGMILFCLAEGLLLRRARRLFEALWMAGGWRLMANRRAEDKAALFLGRRTVVKAFSEANFEPLCSTWAETPGRIGDPLFPRRFGLLPFFHEVLFEKRPY